MSLLYELGIRLYYIGVLIFSFFNPKARLWIKGRRNQFNTIKEELKTDRPIAWFHAASLGEFEQGRPVMEAMRREMPEYQILLTFFSPSGYEVRKNYAGADYVYYLPLDSHRNARKFVRMIKPTIAIFIKYEFWYNYLLQIIRRDTCLILISAIFRPNQAFFKPYGRWYRKLLKCFDHLFVQDEQSLKLLAKIGVTNATLAGDTRFDRVYQIAANSKKIEIAKQFSNDYFTLVCGSTWDKDEELLVRFINENNKAIRFIIAPHEIDSLHTKELTRSIQKKCILYSEAAGKDLKEFEVLIIDNIGMLSSLYQYGKIAYIGGGFGAGIHNIIEAAVYGMPVVFGPNYQKFREARELIEADGAFPVENFQQFTNTIIRLFNKEVLLRRSSEKARYYVSKNVGSTKTIMQYLTKI